MAYGEQKKAIPFFSHYKLSKFFILMPEFFRNFFPSIFRFSSIRWLFLSLIFFYCIIFLFPVYRTKMKLFCTPGTLYALCYIVWICFRLIVCHLKKKKNWRSLERRLRENIKWMHMKNVWYYHELFRWNTQIAYITKETANAHTTTTKISLKAKKPNGVYCEATFPSFAA